MRIPAISFRPVVTEQIDDGFYALPHGLSHQAFATDDLLQMLQLVLDGELGPADGLERRHLFQRYMTGQEGPLACERMITVLKDICAASPEFSKVSLAQQWLGVTMASGRFLIKHVKSFFPGSHAPPEFHRHRYPGVSQSEIQHRIDKLQKILCDATPLCVEPISDQVFCIRPV
jgi:hypothetical protein